MYIFTMIFKTLLFMAVVSLGELTQTEASDGSDPGIRVQ